MFVFFLSLKSFRCFSRVPPASAPLPAFRHGASLPLQLRNLSGLHYCLFVKVLCALRQVSFVLCPDSFDILSQTSSLCQALFYFFCCFFRIRINPLSVITRNVYIPTHSERRRRDLNPRAAINDLHPFQGCPFGQLGYFSKCSRISTII